MDTDTTVEATDVGAVVATDVRVMIWSGASVGTDETVATRVSEDTCEIVGMTVSWPFASRENTNDVVTLGTADVTNVCTRLDDGFREITTVRVTVEVAK